MQKLFSQLQKSRKGFTLVETLFAILIFSAALVSLMSIASKGISTTNQVKNETTAYYLAQEGLEVVRNIRDSNYVISTTLGSSNWLQGIVDGGTDCSTASGCYIDFHSFAAAPELAAITSGLEKKIYFDQGRYSNIGADDTGFERTIRLYPTGSQSPSEEYRVESVVTWQAKTIRRSVVLKTIIKKWQ